MFKVDDRKPECRSIASIQPSNTMYAAGCSSVRPSRWTLGFCRAARNPFHCTRFVGLGAQANAAESLSPALDDGKVPAILKVTHRPRPHEVGRALMARGADLTRAVLEAVAIEAYRSGTITPAQVQEMLGLRFRWETESFLHRAEVYHDYTMDDLDRDIAAMRDASRQ